MCVKYFVFLLFYWFPLNNIFSYVIRLCTLIKKSFFSDFISTDGKLASYKVSSTYRDSESGSVSYKYVRTYEYTVDGSSHIGTAYGECKNGNIGKIQKIKYNPNDFDDIVVENDFGKWVFVVLINLIICILITVLLKLSFIPDFLLVSLLMGAIRLFFYGANYLRNNSGKNSINNKLKLSDQAKINREVDVDEGSIHYVEPIHCVKYNPNDKNIENNILNQILSHDKNFSVTFFKQKATLYFNDVLRAYKSNDFNKVRVFATDNYFKTDCHALKDINFNDYDFSSFIFSNILDYKVDGQFEVLDYQVTGKWKCLHNNSEFGSTYCMQFVRKYGVLTKSNDSVVSTNCPNCGADTDVTSIGECKYCGKVITTGDYSWVLNKICYWDER